MSISGGLVGSYSQMGKTFIIEDENGNEITGVIVDKQTIFTAGDNDVREGVVYASDGGMSTGTKVIPSYHTNHGAKLIPVGDDFKIQLPTLNCYDYTVIHCILCTWNTNLSNSVAADKIVVLDGVYPVQSVEKLSTVTKDDDSASIVLGITNNTETPYVLRYITCKEIE